MCVTSCFILPMALGSDRGKHRLREFQANVKGRQDMIPGRPAAKLCALFASALGSRRRVGSRASHTPLEGRNLLVGRTQPCLRVTGGSCQTRAACPEPRAGPQGILPVSQSCHQMGG